jgi:hypothetical protein
LYAHITLRQNAPTEIIIRIEIAKVTGAKAQTTITQVFNARSRIRTGEPLREWTLNPSPLTWLGDPRTIVLKVVLLSFYGFCVKFLI